MDTKLQEITLDINDLHSYEYLYTKQYDVGRQFFIYITKDSQPYDISNTIAYIELKKPDGTIITNPCLITDINKVAVGITAQMSVIPGIAPFQISFTDGDNVITTVTGKLNIERSSVQNDDIESSDEFGFLSDLIVQIEECKAATQNAKISEQNAKISEDNAKTYETNALNSANIATEQASSASVSASTATTQANNASLSALNASTSETNAATSASVAVSKANEAENSALSASNSETNALTYSRASESYAVGTGGYREDESIDNSKYYYEQAKEISESLGGVLIPMGTIPFEELSEQTKTVGHMYNISNEFVTTSDFREGAGHTMPAGTNVYCTFDKKWDCLAGTIVTGVKGENESVYRKGNISITKNDIGLGNVENKASQAEIVSLSEPDSQELNDTWLQPYSFDDGFIEPVPDTDESTPEY